MQFLVVEPKKRMLAHEALRNNWVRGKATRNENLENCLNSLPSLTFVDFSPNQNGSIDQERNDDETRIIDQDQLFNWAFI